MLRKVLRIAGWAIGSIVGVVAALYLVAVAINWRDRPISPDALRLKASYDNRPTVADRDNAYVYLLAIDAPLEADAHDLGARRLAWLRETAEQPFGYPGDPQTASLDYASGDPLVEQFLTACATDSRACADAFADNSGFALDQWLQTHSWLLQRYRTLLEHGAWREEVFGAARPFPSYAAPIAGQRLLLLEAKSLVDSGDIDGARSLLESDLRFWRMVLESSDALITKMIATAALRQHFTWGALALRGVPSELATAAEPEGWNQPMTAAELSLRRALAGEWVFFSGSVHSLVGSGLRAEGDSALTRIDDRLLLPLLKEQDTLNRHAAYLGKLANTLEAPLPGYAAAAAAAATFTEKTAADALPPRSLYNVFGAVALGAAPPDYSSYARRVADVEGIRRAALAVLHARQRPIADIQATLAAPSLRNPYDDEPLRWDANENAVVFVGLEPGERGEHRLYY
jgi:hypothetical protein